ncbi:G protein-coupled glucose receptor regulating Gpa2-domain-containing protein [Whalleya microplaca]|nr:G protein-coupled glucose receptor regulating Gpa2-domain-containing protein [Whalleya microplaca]
MESSNDFRDRISTLSPLPGGHRSGLIAVAIFGTASFVSSATLFLYLTYKLVTWHFNTRIHHSQQEDEERSRENDLSLGLAERDFSRAKQVRQADVEDVQRQRQERQQRKAPNQFLILVYNLFFADMHQATAFMLNISWLEKNEITVGTPTCWAQGWFVSTGDLAASLFISTIAIHSYITVVKGYKPPNWALYLTITLVWVFVYVMGIVGVASTNNGKEVGGFYVRAAAWCWVNENYESLRLWLHYFWIFMSLATTSIFYILIFFSLRQKKHDTTRPLPHSHASASRRSHNINPPTQNDTSGYPPAFLMYPLIYVVCTAPLALGRILAMAHKDVSIAYFCLAGSLIASNGWLDVILFSTTRHSIIFNASPDAEDTGLETFAFMRTPYGRRYGNMVWVQGGVRGSRNEEAPREGARTKPFWERLGWISSNRWPRSGARGWVSGQNSVSQESLRGTRVADNGIQMDTVTTVVVELESDKKSRSREPSQHSIDSSEKGIAHRARSLRL